MTVEPTKFIGLLRSVSSVKEHVPTTTPKAKPNAGVFHYVELVMDDGKTYFHYSKNKEYLENFKIFIDKELEGEVLEGPKGLRIKFNNLPADYEEKYPQEPKKKEPPLTENMYWTKRFERENQTNAAIEQQFYMSKACDFFLALGRLTDGNSEELLDKALAYGLEKYKQYGRTHG